MTRFARAAAALALALAGCAPLAIPASEDLGYTCHALTRSSFQASQIDLPNGGITLLTAALVPAAAAVANANGTTTPATPDYCKVLGAIAPVDAKAPLIHFQINLPIAWNRKVVQYGGGGLNGVLITGLNPLPDAPPDAVLPLTQGYLTLGTDSGHQASAHPPIELGAWALNDEALVNFAYASYKKVRDAAHLTALRFYGRRPERTYFFGGSEGGREGLAMAQRFPEAYDGVVSVVPVINWMGLMHAYLPSQKRQLSGGWLPPAKITVVAEAVRNECDALDGLADGVVNNYSACAARFNVRTLRCPAGRDGVGCLSDAQVETLAAIHTPYRFPFPLANGVTSYPRWLWGAEDVPGGMQQWVTGQSPPTFPSQPGQATHWTYGNNVSRYFIARNAAFDPRGYTPEAFKSRVEQVSALMDATNPDLSAFHARGGKVILRENMGDYAQSPLAGVEYFKAVVRHLGEPRVEEFMRLYLSTASAHSGLGRSTTDKVDVPTAVDLLDPLDRWVTVGEAPGDVLVQVRKAPVAPFDTLASRPLCRYPDYPHYVSGDKQKADSYRCRVSLPAR
jgi:feruloyl esterase